MPSRGSALEFRHSLVTYFNDNNLPIMVFGAVESSYPLAGVDYPAISLDLETVGDLDMLVEVLRFSEAYPTTIVENFELFGLDEVEDSQGPWVMSMKLHVIYGE